MNLYYKVFTFYIIIIIIITTTTGSGGSGGSRSSVLPCRGLCDGPIHSSRGALRSVVCWVWSRNHTVEA
jgi:hypothetical protein